MKKILLVSLLLLLVCSFARAEFIPQTYNYDKASFQWYMPVYNNTNKIICSNTVVTIDYSVASGAYGFVAYGSQKTATAYMATLGVADEDIASKTIGRVCVKGPHLVRVAVNNVSAKDSAVNTVSRYPRIGDAVVNAGGTFNVGHVSGSGYSNIGGVVRATAAVVATSKVGPFGKILGHRIGQTSSAGTANYASSAADDLIYIWVEPSISLQGSTITN